MPLPERTNYNPLKLALSPRVVDMALFSLAQAVEIQQRGLKRKGTKKQHLFLLFKFPLRFERAFVLGVSISGVLALDDALDDVSIVVVRFAMETGVGGNAPLGGVARRRCSAALLEGVARWRCSAALLGGVARESSLAAVGSLKFIFTCLKLFGKKRFSPFPALRLASSITR